MQPLIQQFLVLGQTCSRTTGDTRACICHMLYVNKWLLLVIGPNRSNIEHQDTQGLAYVNGKSISPGVCWFLIKQDQPGPA